MSSLAPTLQAFFTDRLIKQRRSSPLTVAAYRDTFRLLLDFVYQHSRKPPFELGLDDLGAPIIAAFLEHLEQGRGNSIRTRNARLAALHSFFKFASFRHPEHAALIQRVLAIPMKRYDRGLVTFLTRPEVDALVAAPDCSTWMGRRDHALLMVAVQTGLRRLGTGKARLPGRASRRRRACALSWQRTQGSHYAAYYSVRRGLARVDARTPWSVW
jgi:integrase/recombinase XerD